MRAVQTSHSLKHLGVPLGLCPSPQHLHELSDWALLPHPAVGGNTSLGIQLGGSRAGCLRGAQPGWGAGQAGMGAQGGNVSGSLPSPIIPAGCPHAGQPLARLQAVPGGEHSFWVRWEAPPAPVAAYVLEWQRVALEPGGCSTCWQMERDGAATAALIQGKLGAAGVGSLPSWSAVSVGGVCVCVPGDWHPS